MFTGHCLDRGHPRQCRPTYAASSDPLLTAQIAAARVLRPLGHIPRPRHPTEWRLPTTLPSVTLGGRRVPVERPRVRAADGSGEVAVPSYELCTSTEILGKMAMEKRLAGLSTRRYGVGLEPVGDQVEQRAKATSKSAVSRKFVAMTEHALSDLLAADLSELDLVALMIDGVHFADHLCVVALGIDIDGTKHPLALGGGIDGEHHAGPLAAGRPARTRPRRHHADPGRPGRRQGACGGGQRGVRQARGRSVPTTQDP